MKDLIYAIRLRRTWFATIGLNLVISFMPQPAAEASTYTVDTIEDPWVLNIHEKCGLADGDCSLRTAIRKANANSGVEDIIVILPEIYTLSQEGRNEDAALTGDLDITDDVIITTPSWGNAGNTVIDGGEIDRVFHILSPAKVKIENLTIRNGYLEADPYPPNLGAGILNSGNLKLENCVVTSNINEDFYGGGVANRGGWLEIEKSSIKNNNATPFGGGGIYNSGDAFGNTGTLQISNSTIGPGNTAVIGGGLYNASLDGGGSAQAFVFQTTIESNLSTGGASGVYNAGDINVSDSTFAFNHGSPSACSGFDGESLDNKGVVELKNVTFGGYNGCANPDILNRQGGLISFTNTLIQGTCGCGYHSNVHPCGFTSYGGNIEESDTCYFTEGTDRLAVDNPGLGVFDYFGGFSRSFSLELGSPAIDTGGNSLCTKKDQRGLTRPQDGDGDDISRCDIGAFERSRGDLFTNGFESGNTTAWSASVGGY